MRPYKKRSFYSHVQAKEHPMDEENEDELEIQVGNSSPSEDNVEKDKDKEKDGGSKGRRRWKRKISRKQFRHHDIKIFTPGEYKTSTLLKQKDHSPTDIRKPDGIIKESITDAIVTSLGGQKQQIHPDMALHKKTSRTESTTDNNTKNEMEENNNTHSVQNNNNVGKHNLPAIIMETPPVSRRSMEKSTTKPADLNSSKKITIEMKSTPDNPTLNPAEDENRRKQVQTVNSKEVGGIATSRVEDTSDKSHQNGVANKHRKSTTESTPYNPQPKQTLKQTWTREVQSKQINATSTSEEPENLSIKRKSSSERPVDLSRKYHHLMKDSQRPLFERNLEKARPKEPEKQYLEPVNFINARRLEAAVGNSMEYPQTTVNNSVPVTTSVEYSSSGYASSSPITSRNSPETQRSLPPYPPVPQYRNKDPTVSLSNEIENLVPWKHFLHRILKQPFSLQVLDLIAQVYQQIEKIKKDARTSAEGKAEAENLLSQANAFILVKLEQMRLNLTPSLLMKIFSDPENTPEKKVVQNYIENIEQSRNNPRQGPGATNTNIPLFPSPYMIPKLPTYFPKSPPPPYMPPFPPMQPLPKVAEVFQEPLSHFPKQYRYHFLDTFSMISHPYLNHKEPNPKVTNASGRPRSKSYRTEQKPVQRPLRRTISNPQPGPLISDKYRIPTLSPFDFNMNNFPDGYNAAMGRPNYPANREALTDPVPLPRHRILQEFPDVFFQNLQTHAAKGNLLPVNVHPGLLPKVPGAMSNRYGYEVPGEAPPNGQMPKSTQNYHIPTMPPQPQPPKTTFLENHASSTKSHLEVSKTVAVAKPPVVQMPPEKSVSMPAVIVADRSMQITKETGESHEQQTPPVPKKPVDDNSVRMTVLRSTKEMFPKLEARAKRTIDKDQEENSPEFLVWMEKIKNNEKLKSKLLSQIGIVKKEEPTDTIEIVDSDDETPPHEDQHPNETVHKPTPNPQGTSEISVSTQHHENVIKIPNPPPAPASSRLPSPLKTPIVPPRPVNAPESLSKKDYIPPIPLPYIPTTNALASDKTIYSPQIEPISPPGNESSFVFPETTTSAKLPDSSTLQPNRKNPNLYGQYRKENLISSSSKAAAYSADSTSKSKQSLERPQTPSSPRVMPHGKLCYVRDNHMFIRYFDDTQMELFIRNLSLHDDELLKTTGIDPENLKSPYSASKQYNGAESLSKTETINLPRDVEFSRKEELQDVEEFVKESNLVEHYVPKDFASFYRYVTGFQIIKNKHPVSLQTFLTMYNTNRTAELLWKYLQRIDESTTSSGIR